MSQDDVAALLKRHGDLKSDRQQWEGHWRQITRRVLPRQDDFQGSRSQGARRSEYIFDSTAPLALRWLSKQGVAAIPRSSNPQRIVDNFKVFDFTLSDDEMSRIAALRRPDGRIANPVERVSGGWD